MPTDLKMLILTVNGKRRYELQCKFKWLSVADCRFRAFVCGVEDWTDVELLSKSWHPLSVFSVFLRTHLFELCRRLDENWWHEWFNNGNSSSQDGFRQNELFVSAYAHNNLATSSQWHHWMRQRLDGAERRFGGVEWVCWSSSIQILGISSEEPLHLLRSRDPLFISLITTFWCDCHLPFIRTRPLSTWSLKSFSSPWSESHSLIWTLGLRQIQSSPQPCGQRRLSVHVIPAQAMSQFEKHGRAQSQWAIQSLEHLPRFQRLNHQVHPHQLLPALFQPWSHPHLLFHPPAASAQ